jgi:hypothetical protein
MPKLSRGEDTSRHHVVLFKSDWDLLMHHHGPGSGSSFGPSDVVRLAVRQYCNKLRAKQEELLSQGTGTGSGPEIT